MENTMSMFDHSEPGQGLLINETSRAFLLEAARWGKFISIVGFVFFGIMILGGIAMMLLPAMGEAVSKGGVPGVVMGLIYVGGALIYFFPMWMLFRYSTNIRKAIVNEDNDQLALSFRYLKGHFKAVGIILIIMIFMYALVIIFALVMGVVAAVA